MKIFILFLATIVILEIGLLIGCKKIMEEKDCYYDVYQNGLKIDTVIYSSHSSFPFSVCEVEDNLGYPMNSSIYYKLIDIKKR